MIAIPLNLHRPFYGLLSRYVGGYRIACEGGCRKGTVRVDARQLLHLKLETLALLETLAGL
jgi:hypothetical protein